MSDEKKSDNISKSGYWSAAVLNTKVKVKHDIWMKMLKVDNYLVRRNSCTIGCWCEEILLQIIPLSSQHVLLKTSGRESSRRFVPNQLLCQACPLEADSVFLLRFFIFNRTQKWSRLGLLQEEQWELPKSGQKTACWVAKHSPEKLPQDMGEIILLPK